MEEVLRSTSQPIDLTIRDKNEILLDPDGNLVNALVKDSAGTTVIASSAATRISAGLYRITVDQTVTNMLDTYTIEWSATISSKANKYITEFEVVGKFFFTVKNLRDSHPDLADTTVYSTQALTDAREFAEELFENECGVAFRPRGRRATLDGSGTKEIFPDDRELRKLVSASIGGTVFAQAEIDDVAVYPNKLLRKLKGFWTAGDKNVVLLYEHGLDAPPEPVRREAIVLARSRLIQNLGKAPIDSRVISVSTDDGTYRLAQAGRDGPTGIPSVDAVLEQFSRQLPGVA
jgi:hypothetical protein